MRFSKRYFTLLLACPVCSLSFAAANAHSQELDIYSLSLEELVNIKVNTGSLFSGTAKDSPSSITVIDRQKIELSGANNIATLLEQYVPGMILMTHSEGNKIGLRGHIAAENYKLLLLVNGKNITNMVYEGAITEIDQWEMGDIERIEVVSGAGSVTYGTGAIAGVINIITKTAKDNLPKFSVGFTRNDSFDSNGINLQYAETINDWGIYAYASYRETDGLDSPDYFKLNPSEPSDNRYVGKGLNPNAPPQDFLADSRDRAQIKAHIDISHNDNFSAFLRYTQSGQTRSFSQKARELDENGAQVGLDNANQPQTRSLVLSSDYRFDFENNTSLQTSLTFDTQEYVRYRYLDQGSTNNIKDYAFSQDRLTASALYNLQLADNIDVIAGYEYSRIDVGAPWGENKDHLWIREGAHIISSWENSAYTQDLTLNGRPNPNDFVEIGSGITFETHSQLLESKFSLSDNNTLFYAHRFDHSDVSQDLFSPRLSLLTQFNKNNTLVSTLQRAQRRMPLRAQYLNHVSNNDSKLETLDSLEFSFTNESLSNTSLNIKTYYNEISAVGFTGSQLEFLTDYNLFGIDLNATYKHDDLEISINHTYMKPLNIDMNDKLKTGLDRNNISFADYYLQTRSGIPILLESYGDSLNNWSKNITKFSISQSFMNQRLKAQLNAQIFWDYEGSYDEMRMYQRAYNNLDRSSLSPSDQALFEQQYQDFLHEKELLKKQDAFELDYSVNASMAYTWSTMNATEFKLKVFVENIFESSYRYNVSTGSNRAYPERLEFLDKPRMFGASMQVNF